MQKTMDVTSKSKQQCSCKGVTVSLQLLVKYTNFWLPIADMHLFWQAFFFFFFLEVHLHMNNKEQNHKGI